MREADAKKLEAQRLEEVKKAKLAALVARLKNAVLGIDAPSKYKLLHKMELSDCKVGEIYEMRGYMINCAEMGEVTACNPTRQDGWFRFNAKKEYFTFDKVKDGTLVKYIGVTTSIVGGRERTFEEVTE